MRSKSTNLMNEIKKFAEEYYLEYWKSPSTSEIAGAVGVTRATVYRTVPFSVPQIKRKDIRTLRFTTCKSKA